MILRLVIILIFIAIYVCDEYVMNRNQPLGRAIMALMVYIFVIEILNDYPAQVEEEDESAPRVNQVEVRTTRRGKSIILTLG